MKELQDLKPILKLYEQRNFKTIQKIPLPELEKVIHKYYITHQPLKTAIFIIYGVMAISFIGSFVIGKVTTPIIIIIFSLLAVALFFNIKYMVRYNKLIKTLKALANKYHVKLEVFSKEYNQMAMYIYGGRGIGRLKNF